MSETLPLPRPLHAGMQGRDVSAMQRALRAWNPRARPYGATGVFGGPTQTQLKQFQLSKRIQATGWYGPATHVALAPHYDRYGHLLMELAEAGLHPKKTVRQRIVEAAYLGYRNRSAIHYTQSGQRMQGVREQLKPPHFPVWEDCSSFVTWCYYAAGAPDPNGRGYDGLGYTGTQFPRGAHVASPMPGDLVFYGGGSVPKHVAVYVGKGLVISHGSEPGPYLLPRNYRSDEVGVRSYLPTD
jgi:Putative peptidoglycan binding domain/NlpC/P60 family